MFTNDFNLPRCGSKKLLVHSFCFVFTFLLSTDVGDSTNKMKYQFTTDPTWVVRKNLSETKKNVEIFFASEEATCVDRTAVQIEDESELAALQVRTKTFCQCKNGCCSSAAAATIAKRPLVCAARTRVTGTLSRTRTHPSTHAHTLSFSDVLLLQHDDCRPKQRQWAKKTLCSYMWTCVCVCAQHTQLSWLKI